MLYLSVEHWGRGGRCSLCLSLPQQGNEGSPRSTQSSRKKNSPSPDTIPPSGNGTETEREGRGRRRKTPSPPPAPQQQPVATVPEKQLPPDDDDKGGFQLVTSKSPRGKKETAPVVKPSSSLETGKDASAQVSKKRKREEAKAAALRKTSSAEKVPKGGKGDVPVVTEITETERETPAVSKATAATEDDPVISTETTPKLETSKTSLSKEAAPAVTKKTRGRKQAGKRQVRSEGNSEKVVSSGSGEEGEKEEG